jgi:hypothetical protein
VEDTGLEAASSVEAEVGVATGLRSVAEEEVDDCPPHPRVRKRWWRC